VTGHLGDKVDVEGVESGVQAHAGCGRRGFASGVSSPDHDHVELFGKALHRLVSYSSNSWIECRGEAGVRWTEIDKSRWQIRFAACIVAPWIGAERFSSCRMRGIPPALGCSKRPGSERLLPPVRGLRSRRDIPMGNASRARKCWQ